MKRDSLEATQFTWIDFLNKNFFTIFKRDQQSHPFWWELTKGHHASRIGSLPFAGLARAGFIAVQMLQSLVSVGTLSDDDSSAFMRSISTISKQMTLDLALHDKTIFFSKVYFLRTKMSPKEIFSQLSHWIVILCLKSHTFCLYFILFLHVWIRIFISYMDPDPQSSWIWIQFISGSGLGSTTLNLT